MHISCLPVMLAWHHRSGAQCGLRSAAAALPLRGGHRQASAALPGARCKALAGRSPRISGTLATLCSTVQRPAHDNAPFLSHP